MEENGGRVSGKKRKKDMKVMETLRERKGKRIKERKRKQKEKEETEQQ